MTTLPRSKTSRGIAFHQIGAGLPVVLIHGVGLRADCWFQQMDVLSSDYQVFALDMPGHGLSRAISSSQPTLNDFIDEVHHAFAEVVAQPAVIVGHSMGALIAIEYASRYPENCLGVIALNAVYQRTQAAKLAVKERAQQLRAGSAHTGDTINRWFESTDPERADVVTLCESWLSIADAQGYATAYGVFAESDGPGASSLQALSMPALFVTGSDDANSSVQMSRKMASLAPYGKIEIIDQSKHMMLLTHPSPLNTIMLDFIDSALSHAHRETSQ